MTRYLLDTNIVSNLIKPSPSESLVAWMEIRPNQSLFISSWTIAEIARGVLTAPRGRKRQRLEEWFQGAEGPPALFAGRTLVFDNAAALIWARLMAEGHSAGRSRSPLDMIIAAIAEAQDCVLVTDNERDFSGVPFINPMRSVDR